MDIRNNYVIALKGKIDALQEKTETHTPNDNYENFVNTHFETKKKIEINLESYEKHLRLEKNVQTWKLPPNPIGESNTDALTLKKKHKMNKPTYTWNNRQNTYKIR